jgi:hypothetical protein
VAVVARAGQALGGDRPPLGARPGLEDVEEAEAHGLLDLRVAVELDIGAGPELVEVVGLARDEPFPAGVAGLGEGGGDLTANRRQRARARPSVGEELHDLEALTDQQVRVDGDACEVGGGLRAEAGAVRPGHDVVHPRRHAQAARARDVREQGRGLTVAPRLRLERRAQRRGRARVALRNGEGLVGDELRLHDDAGAGLERLDDIAHRGDPALDERDEAHGRDPHGLAGG